MSLYNADKKDDIEKLKRMLIDSDNTVFLTGAGMSTDSGIPDFRGSRGIYTVSEEESPEYLISRECLICEPEKFFENYRTKLLYPDAEPNRGHYALAELEKKGLIQELITQNIDTLHERAGSRNVIKLHGTTLRNYCIRCGKEYPDKFIAQTTGIPHCSCGGIVRPDVVLYGEGVPEKIYTAAENAAYDARLMVVVGSSLAVNTASSIVRCFGGGHLVIINRTPTSYDRYADLVIHGEISDILPALCEND